MPTQGERNLALNRFMGWEPNEWCKHCAVFHDIRPFGYFADTPEARERVRLLKDEFLRRKTGHFFKGMTGMWRDKIHYWAMIKKDDRVVGRGSSTSESRAILDAIYEAIK